jgi:hypothetical protein
MVIDLYWAKITVHNSDVYSEAEASLDIGFRRKLKWENKYIIMIIVANLQEKRRIWNKFVSENNSDS